MNRRTVLSLALSGAVGVGAGAALARLLTPTTVPLETGTWLPQAAPLPEFHLSDLSGRDFSLADLRGHPTLLLFGFTNCPDVCPVALTTLTQVQRSAPLPHSRAVFVSIDPERDSAAILRVYLGAFGQDVFGARGSDAALSPLLKGLGAISARQNLPDGGYTMVHSATLYLLDTRGRLAAVFSPPFSASGLTADLRRIAATNRL